MTEERISSGIRRTVAVGASGGETAEARAVEEQRAPLADVHGDDVTRHQLVVAAVEDVTESALQYRQRPVDHGRPGDPVRPPDAPELVATRHGEGAAQRLLMLFEDVHAERARSGDARPAGRAARRGENDH